ncbi:hypothetical protein IWX90DRAFT_415771 [Phyllosticta citrichinensis]|uniref:Uncharacterized protein n=1 Tax=Phyllosticta citrichinensis TaxID=1130410 RepID=A0ABR1XQK8_9PEZI
MRLFAYSVRWWVSWPDNLSHNFLIGNWLLRQSSEFWSRKLPLSNFLMIIAYGTALATNKIPDEGCVGISAGVWSLPGSQMTYFESLAQVYVTDIPGCRKRLARDAPFVQFKNIIN